MSTSFKSNNISYTLIVAVIFFFSCKQLDLFEKNNPIPNHSWSSRYSSNAQFLITDTNAVYNIFIILRHTDAYKYNNIWLNIGIKVPKDTMQFKKINLVLGDDSKGWDGTGMGDIWYVKRRINNQPYKFKKSGVYEFSIFNIMRDDPLLEIMSVGISVEKLGQ